MEQHFKIFMEVNRNVVNKILRIVGIRYPHGWRKMDWDQYLIFRQILIKHQASDQEKLEFISLVRLSLLSLVFCDFVKSWRASG